MNLHIVFQLFNTLSLTKKKHAVLFEKCHLNDGYVLTNDDLQPLAKNNTLNF